MTDEKAYYSEPDAILPTAVKGPLRRRKRRTGRDGQRGPDHLRSEWGGTRGTDFRSPFDNENKESSKYSSQYSSSEYSYGGNGDQIRKDDSYGYNVHANVHAPPSGNNRPLEFDEMMLSQENIGNRGTTFTSMSNRPNSLSNRRIHPKGNEKGSGLASQGEPWFGDPNQDIDNSQQHVNSKGFGKSSDDNGSAELQPIPSQGMRIRDSAASADPLDESGDYHENENCQYNSQNLTQSVNSQPNGNWSDTYNTSFAANPGNIAKKAGSLSEFNGINPFGSQDDFPGYDVGLPSVMSNGALSAYDHEQNRDEARQCGEAEQQYDQGNPQYVRTNYQVTIGSNDSPDGSSDDQDQYQRDEHQHHGHDHQHQHPFPGGGFDMLVAPPSSGIYEAGSYATSSFGCGASDFDSSFNPGAYAGGFEVNSFNPEGSHNPIEGSYNLGEAYKPTGGFRPEDSFNPNVYSGNPEDLNADLTGGALEMDEDHTGGVHGDDPNADADAVHDDPVNDDNEDEEHSSSRSADDNLYGLDDDINPAAFLPRMQMSPQGSKTHLQMSDMNANGSNSGSGDVNGRNLNKGATCASGNNGPHYVDRNEEDMEDISDARLENALAARLEGLHSSDSNQRHIDFQPNSLNSRQNSHMHVVHPNFQPDHPFGNQVSAFPGIFAQAFYNRPSAADVSGPNQQNGEAASGFSSVPHSREQEESTETNPAENESLDATLQAESTMQSLESTYQTGVSIANQPISNRPMCNSIGSELGSSNYSTTRMSGDRNTDVSPGGTRRNGSRRNTDANDATQFDRTLSDEQRRDEQRRDGSPLENPEGTPIKANLSGQISNSSSNASFRADECDQTQTVLGDDFVAGTYDMGELPSSGNQGSCELRSDDSRLRSGDSKLWSENSRLRSEEHQKSGSSELLRQQPIGSGDLEKQSSEMNFTPSIDDLVHMGTQGGTVADGEMPNSTNGGLIGGRLEPLREHPSSGMSGMSDTIKNTGEESPFGEKSTSFETCMSAVTLAPITPTGIKPLKRLPTVSSIDGNQSGVFCDQSSSGVNQSNDDQRQATPSSKNGRGSFDTADNSFAGLHAHNDAEAGTQSTENSGSMPGMSRNETGISQRMSRNESGITRNESGRSMHSSLKGNDASTRKESLNSLPSNRNRGSTSSFVREDSNHSFPGQVTGSINSDTTGKQIATFTFSAQPTNQKPGLSTNLFGGRHSEIESFTSSKERVNKPGMNFGNRGDRGSFNPSRATDSVVWIIPDIGMPIGMPDGVPYCHPSGGSTHQNGGNVPYDTVIIAGQEHYLVPVSQGEDSRRSFEAVPSLVGASAQPSTNNGPSHGMMRKNPAPPKLSAKGGSNIDENPYVSNTSKQSYVSNTVSDISRGSYRVEGMRTNQSGVSQSSPPPPHGSSILIFPGIQPVTPPPDVQGGLSPDFLGSSNASRFCEPSSLGSPQTPPAETGGTSILLGNTSKNSSMAGMITYDDSTGNSISIGNNTGAIFGSNNTTAMPESLQNSNLSQQSSANSQSSSTRRRKAPSVIDTSDADASQQAMKSHAGMTPHARMVYPPGQTPGAHYVGNMIHQPSLQYIDGALGQNTMSTAQINQNISQSQSMVQNQEPVGHVVGHARTYSGHSQSSQQQRLSYQSQASIPGMNLSKQPSPTHIGNSSSNNLNNSSTSVFGCSSSGSTQGNLPLESAIGSNSNVAGQVAGQDYSPGSVADGQALLYIGQGTALGRDNLTQFRLVDSRDSQTLGRENYRVNQTSSSRATEMSRTTTIDRVTNAESRMTTVDQNRTTTIVPSSRSSFWRLFTWEYWSTNFFSWILYEVAGFSSGPSGSGGNKAMHLEDLMRTPLRLEKTLNLGVILCFDTVLHELTFMPLNVVIALIRKYLFGRRMTRIEISETFRLALLVLNTFFIGYFIDFSFHYHYIRSQSFMKLYVFFNMLEILERLARSLGNDLFDVLLEQQSPGSPDDLDKTNSSSSSSFSSDGDNNGGTNFKLVLSRTLVTIVYCVIHTLMHIIRVLLLNIALNSPGDSAMFLLIVTNNFGELKSSVFKRYEGKGLFVIMASDMVERTYLLVDIFLVLARLYFSPRTGYTGDLSPGSRGTTTSGSMSVMGILSSFIFGILSHIFGFITGGWFASGEIAFWLMLMITMEIGVDWFKLSFITKANSLPVSTFEYYKDVLVMDVLGSRMSKDAFSEYSNKKTTTSTKVALKDIKSQGTLADLNRSQGVQPDLTSRSQGVVQDLVTGGQIGVDRNISERSQARTAPTTPLTMGIQLAQQSILGQPQSLMVYQQSMTIPKSPDGTFKRGASGTTVGHSISGSNLSQSQAPLLPPQASPLTPQGSAASTLQSEAFQGNRQGNANQSISQGNGNQAVQNGKGVQRTNSKAGTETVTTPRADMTPRSSKVSVPSGRTSVQNPNHGTTSGENQINDAREVSSRDVVNRDATNNSTTRAPTSSVRDTVLRSPKTAMKSSSSSKKARDLNFIESPFRGVYGYSHIPVRRIGFVALPLTAMIICHLPILLKWFAGWKSKCFILFIIYLNLCLFKILLSILLVGYSVRRATGLGKLPETFYDIKAL